MALFQILVDIATNTAKLESGLTRANSQIDAFAGKIKRLGELALESSLALFVERIISTGAELERASIRAGTSGKAFSELAYAAKQSGVGTDQLATAMSKMGRALSEASTGSKEPVAALRALGLTVNDLKNLRPEQQLEIIADRFSRLPSPADKARVAIDLFGRAGAELEPLLSRGAQGIIELRQEAQRLGASFSDELLKQLEEAHESINRLETSFSALATTLVGKASPAIAGLLDNVTALVSGDEMLKLRVDLDFLRRMSQEAGFLSFGNDPNLGGFGFKSSKEAKRLADELQQKIDAAKLVLKPEDLQSPGAASLLGGTAPGFQNQATVEEIHVNRAKIAFDRLQELYRGWDNQTATETERQVQQFTHFSDVIDLLIHDSVISATEGSRRTAEELDKILPGVEVTARRMKVRFKYEMDEMEQLGEATAASIQQSFANFLFNPFHDGLRRMLIEFLEALRRMAAQAAASQIFQSLFGGSSTSNKGGSGLGGILGGILSSAFGGGRAGGGGVTAGTSYLVGENGPELFTAASHGTISPLGGAVNIGDTHLHVDARGADSSVDAKLAAILPPILAAHAARIKSDTLQAFRRTGLAAPVRA